MICPAISGHGAIKNYPEPKIIPPKKKYDIFIYLNNNKLIKYTIILDDSIKEINFKENDL